MDRAAHIGRLHQHFMLAIRDFHQLPLGQRAMRRGCLAIHDLFVAAKEGQAGRIRGEGSAPSTRRIHPAPHKAKW